MTIDLKQCLTKIANKENIMTILYEEERRVLTLQLFSAFQILKNELEDFHSTKAIEDLWVDIFLTRGDEGDNLEVCFRSDADNPTKVWSDLSKREILLNDALSYIRVHSKQLGEISKGGVSINLCEEKLPDLAAIILSQENKAIYESTLLEISLADKTVETSKKLKL